jgi:hypothetical protein
MLMIAQTSATSTSRPNIPLKGRFSMSFSLRSAWVALGA